MIQVGVYSPIKLSFSYDPESNSRKSYPLRWLAVCRINNTAKEAAIKHILKNLELKLKLKVMPFTHGFVMITEFKCKVFISKLIVSIKSFLYFAMSAEWWNLPVKNKIHNLSLWNIPIEIIYHNLEWILENTNELGLIFVLFKK